MPLYLSDWVQLLCGKTARPPGILVPKPEHFFRTASVFCRQIVKISKGTQVAESLILQCQKWRYYEPQSTKIIILPDFTYRRRPNNMPFVTTHQESFFCKFKESFILPNSTSKFYLPIHMFDVVELSVNHTREEWFNQPFEDPISFL